MILSIIDARVVDLPEPVGPVTRISPLGFAASSFKTGGSPSISSEGMVELRSLIVAASFPSCLNTFTRCLLPSEEHIAKSASSPSSRSALCSSVSISTIIESFSALLSPSNS